MLGQWVAAIMMISGVAVFWAGANLIARSSSAGASARSQARADELQNQTRRYGIGFTAAGLALTLLGVLILVDVSHDREAPPFTTHLLDLIAPAPMNPSLRGQ